MENTGGGQITTKNIIFMFQDIRALFEEIGLEV